MSQIIRVLTVADLHRSAKLYSLLEAAVTKHRPDVVALVGDFLDATGQTEGKLSTAECAQALSRLKCPEVVFIRGNHEDSALWTFAEEWRPSGREFHLLEAQAFTYGSLVIVGFPCLLGCGDGTFDTVPADPNRWLPKLVRPLGPAARTLWLMHEPPTGTPLSQDAGVLSGNPEWRDAIERYVPWLVVFGHDHRMTAHGPPQWHCGVGATTCVNVGQSDTGPLHYSLMHLEFPQPGPCLPKRVTVTAYPQGTSITLPSQVSPTTK